ncbi:MAG: histidine kinase, partial [Saprospiraceae bacterium]
DGSSSVGPIYAVYTDRFDFIWFSADAGLFRFDTNTGLYELIPVGKDEYSVPHHNVLYNGFLEMDDGLWISTGGGIAFYEYKTHQFFHRYHNPNQSPVFNVTRKESDFQSDIETDAQGRLWFVREHTHLACYDPLTAQLDTFKFELPEGTWRCCWSICADAHDNIWIGTRHGGILIFNTITHTFTSIRHDGINSLIQSDYIYSIERGPQGQMFVAHDNGLDIIDLYDLSLKEVKLSGTNDFLNLKYESGNITFNEDESAVFVPFYKFGFYKLTLGTDSINSFENAPEYGEATPLIFHWNSKKYISMKGNLYEIDIDAQSYKVTDHKLLPDTVSRIRGHIIWCYGESPSSIYVKKSTGKILHILNGQVEVMKGYGFEPALCISPDSQTLSYVTSHLNLVRRNMKHQQADTILLKPYLDSTTFSFSNPRHMVDDGSSVWVSGQSGILRWDYVHHQLHTYGVEKGLSHSFTFSVVLDLKRNVWVGSIGGIDKYNKVHDRFVSVYKIRGNTYMDAFGNAICSKKGELIFQFGNKIVRLRPDIDDEKKSAPPDIHLDEVLVNGHNIDWKNDNKLVNLSHGENRLTFVYDMLYYDDADLVSFSYRLNSKEWIDNGRRNEINLDGLASGRYKLELSASIGSKSDITSALSIPFRIRQPWWREWWFFALLFLMATAALWIYFKSRIEKFRKELLITRQISDLESKALRAQMNPHFVFNSLNAIQECIVTGRVDEAYTYLSTFSKLLRMVLEHSDAPEVSLQEELEVFSLYLSLEKLRFKDDMQYSLHLDSELDAEEILIPPMLIQPHIENAIWHGLRHKDGEKHLTISITEKPAGYLEVVIEDDGIGRTKAAEMREARLGGNKHRSKGKQLSENRMILLAKSYPSTSMIITDLYSNVREASGTKVVLTIPMLSKRIGSTN